MSGEQRTKSAQKSLRQFASLHAHGRRDIERAANALLAVVAAEGRFVEHGREFLTAAAGLDRGAVVRAAAERLAAALSGATIAEAEAAVWSDLTRLFGWRNVAELQVEGRA